MHDDLGRRIEGAYQVLEGLIVEGGLRADAAIRLGEQRGGDEDPVNSPIEGRRDEPGYVLEDAASDRDKRQVSLGGPPDEIVIKFLNALQGFQLLLDGEHDNVRAGAGL